MSKKRDNINKSTVDAKTKTVRAKNSGWKMPEPIFRISDGTPLGKSSNQSPILKPRQITKDETRGLEFQPRSFISEDSNINQAMAGESKSRIPGINSGILAMALLALAFLTGVYFLFFYKL